MARPSRWSAAARTLGYGGARRVSAGGTERHGWGADERRVGGEDGREVGRPGGAAPAAAHGAEPAHRVAAGAGPGALGARTPRPAGLAGRGGDAGVGHRHARRLALAAVEPD